MTKSPSLVLAYSAEQYSEKKPVETRSEHKTITTPEGIATVDETTVTDVAGDGLMEQTLTTVPAKALLIPGFAQTSRVSQHHWLLRKILRLLAV